MCERSTIDFVEWRDLDANENRFDLNEFHFVELRVSDEWMRINHSRP
jgi:hypothetical protein